jgi:integrase
VSVYRSKGRRTFVFDFWYAGQHHKGNTYQENKDDAKLVEARLKLQLRKERGGIAEPPASPSIAAWAGTYYAHCEKRQARTGEPKRLDRIDENLRVVLRFFGARPSDPDSPRQPQPGEEAPFHDLTLRDLVEEPIWLVEFEEWIDRRQVAGSTRNHYVSTMSRLYAVAMLPAYRKETGITANPFTGIPRAGHVTRKVALTPELVARWLRAMSYHTRLAVAIAALAPKLRLQNILALDRAVHLDPSLTCITVTDHKSDRVTGRPLIVPVTAQLRTILLDAIARLKPGTTRLVQYRGTPVASIRGGLAAAARQAQIPYGRFTAGGVTFHTLRHTAATMFARLGVTPWLGRDALGHQDVTTTDGYTHLQLEDQRVALEQLSAAMPIAAIVTAPASRARRRPEGAVRGPGDQTDE